MKNLYKERQFVCQGCQRTVVLRRQKNNTKFCSLRCYRNSKKTFPDKMPIQLDFFEEKNELRAMGSHESNDT